MRMVIQSVSEQCSHQEVSLQIAVELCNVLAIDVMKRPSVSRNTQVISQDIVPIREGAFNIVFSSMFIYFIIYSSKAQHRPLSFSHNTLL
jgi:hypothetical protein